jgi:hypothetical protein
MDNHNPVDHRDNHSIDWWAIWFGICSYNYGDNNRWFYEDYAYEC